MPSKCKASRQAGYKKPAAGRGEQLDCRFQCILNSPLRAWTAAGISPTSQRIQQPFVCPCQHMQQPLFSFAYSPLGPVSQSKRPLPSDVLPALWLQMAMIYKGHVLEMSGSGIFLPHCLFKHTTKRAKSQEGEKEWAPDQLSTSHSLPSACLSLAS